VNVFLKIRIGVVVQLKEENAPFMITVYCMSHHTNFGVQTFSKMGIVKKIENIVLQSLYAYFSHSLKRTQEFVKLG
jgi:hypothetical protein